MMKILFLGYSRKETNLIDFIKKFKKNIYLKHSKSKLNFKTIKNYDLIICYGYRHIIESKIIDKFKKNIINLHISYLPYNRGAHPNFWSFVENTPSGVTIHLVNKGIDTGKILYQKQINFNLLKNKNQLTFKKTYKVLREELEFLFQKNFEKILNSNFKKFDQIGKGSYHQKSDLPKILKSWNQNIYKTVLDYKKQNKLFLKNKLKLIDKIENTRKNNNFNWMDLVRNSIKNSPKKTLKILKKINSDDKKITELFKKINEKS